jgi:hypothetical protein
MSRYATWWDLGSASGPALGYALLGGLGFAATYGLAALGLAAVMCAFAWTFAAARQAQPRLG